MEVKSCIRVERERHGGNDVSQGKRFSRRPQTFDATATTATTITTATASLTIEEQTVQ